MANETDLSYYSESLESEEEEISTEESSLTELSGFLLHRNTASFKCLAQIEISRSSLLRDPRYHFPEIPDPHLDEALWAVAEPIEFEDDGYTKYKYLCNFHQTVAFRRVLNSLQKETLDLKFYGLSVKAMCIVCKALEHNQNVKHLFLQENILKPAAVACLANLIEKNRTITKLDLRRCQIGKLGVAHFIECFIWTKTLRELDLSHNDLGDEGLQYLAPGLIDNTSIRKLNLSSNNLGDKALKALRPVIEENYFMIDLDLSNNNFYTANGMDDLMKGLAENMGLKTLNLSHNGIGEKETFRPIMVYLKSEYSRLQHLNLSHNRITGIPIKMLKAGLRLNESLVTLNLSFNPITADEIEFLCDLFLEERETPLTLILIDFGKIWVKKSFIPMRNKIRKMGCRIIYGGIYSNFRIYGPNIKEMLLERATFVIGAMQIEKLQKELAPFILGILPDEPMDKDDFIHALEKHKIKLGRDLQQMIIRVWHDKNKQVDVPDMKRVCYQLYPDTIIPPPVEEKKKKKRKRKRKKKVTMT